MERSRDGVRLAKLPRERERGSDADTRCKMYVDTGSSPPLQRRQQDGVVLGCWRQHEHNDAE